LIWWVFTLILAAAVLAPIYLRRLPYPFYIENVAFIAVFVTVTRYAFLLKHTWLAHRRRTKIAIITGSLLLIFILLTSMMDFNNYLEEIGLQDMVKELSADQQYSVIRYIQREVIFFGVGSIIGLVVLSLRLMISLWRMRNSLTKI
jgi:hypothetical protein